MADWNSHGTPTPPSSHFKFCHLTFDFKSTSNHCKSEIRKAHRAYVLNLSKEAHRNTNKFWKFIGSQRRNSQVTSLYFNDVLFSCADDIAKTSCIIFLLMEVLSIFL